MGTQGLRTQFKMFKIVCFEIKVGLNGHLDKNLVEFQWVARGLRALTNK
jgi:hypothetical protein